MQIIPDESSIVRQCTDGDCKYRQKLEDAPRCAEQSRYTAPTIYKPDKYTKHDDAQQEVQA